MDHISFPRNMRDQREVRMFYKHDASQITRLDFVMKKGLIGMSKTVFYIKLIHSLLFFLIVICTIYVFVTAALDQINSITWWALGIAVIELLVLLLNGWRCPLTDLAERYGAEVGSVANLFLPRWLSDYLFTIFGIVFVVSCGLLIWRLWS